MSSVLRLFLSQNSALFRRNHQQVGPISVAFGAPQQTNRFMSLFGTGGLRQTEKPATDDSASSPSISSEERNPLDRTLIVQLEQGLRYLASDAYKQTYGTQKVWEQYRRNHKGPFAPRRTRKTCVRKGVISTGNPCPICRDEYLLLDHRNLELLEQFISPHTGEVRSALCVLNKHECKSKSVTHLAEAIDLLESHDPLAARNIVFFLPLIVFSLYHATDSQLLEDRPVSAHPSTTGHRH